MLALPPRVMQLLRGSALFRSFRHGARRLLLGAAFVATLANASSAQADGRDDTGWLQAKLDAGGSVFIPKLPDGQCYATRGLWVSRDDTSVTSDGACIVALGPGEARIKTGSGRPIRATALFYVDHSDVNKPLPVRITIGGVRIDVPDAKRMDGVSISGHEVTLDHLTIGGAPTTDVLIGGGKLGSAGLTERIVVRDSPLTGGRRDVISAAGPVGLRVERNTLSGGRGLPQGQAGAGLHIRAADRGQPTLDVHALGNTITGNAGPGIFLDLAPANGTPVL